MKLDYEALETMLISDIEQIQKANSLSDAERLCLFQRIMTAYDGIINNLYNGLYGFWIPNGHEAINYAYLKNNPEEVSKNLQFLLRKLQMAKAGFNIISIQPESTSSANEIHI